MQQPPLALPLSVLPVKPAGCTQLPHPAWSAGGVPTAGAWPRRQQHPEQHHAPARLPLPEGPGAVYLQHQHRALPGPAVPAQPPACPQQPPSCERPCGPAVPPVRPPPSQSRWPQLPSHQSPSCWCWVTALNGGEVVERQPVACPLPAVLPDVPSCLLLAVQCCCQVCLLPRCSSLRCPRQCLGGRAEAHRCSGQGGRQPHRRC